MAAIGSTADVDARRGRLLERLRAAADARGFVPFDRFLDLALYDPEAGVYARATPVVGPAGAYYTAAHVHPLFAATVAARIRDVRARLGGPSPFRVVDWGSGDGTLSAGLVRELGADSAGGWEVALVDRSETLRRSALERVAAVVPERRVAVTASGSLAEGVPFAGAIVANELFDAQPVRRLRRVEDGWREQGVRVDGGEIHFAESDRAPEVPGPPLGHPAEGTIVEVSPSAEALLREAADHLELGTVLVLDFGMSQDELWRGHPAGTLAAVRGHRDLGDPLAAAGTADLSTFVNFDRIRAVAATSGLVELEFERQAEALGRWGLADRLAEAVRRAETPEAEVRLRLAAKNLLFGFDRFSVLELASRSAAARLGSVR